MPLSYFQDDYCYDTYSHVLLPNFQAGSSHDVFHLAARSFPQHAFPP